MPHGERRTVEPDIDHHGRAGALTTGTRVLAEPHLECRDPFPTCCKRRHTLPHEPLEHGHDRILAHLPQCHRNVIGMRRLWQRLAERGHERLGPTAHELRKPSCKRRRKPRGEALSRQLERAADRIDAHFAEGGEHVGLDAERRCRQRRQGRGLLAWRHDDEPPGPAKRRGGLTAEPLGMMGGCPGCARRVGDGYTGMDTVRGERPRSRAHERLFSAEEARRAGDIEMDAFGPLGILERHNWGEPAALPRQAFERRPIGGGVV
jgi:hypothetical protein